ncbi:hypothetical protein FQN50_000960 [Emmonsiellopsis sp. PD_5]|nr:hypothetical protein FQN50_000960 [Emmonsiellopsis sp. PD_5]
MSSTATTAAIDPTTTNPTTTPPSPPTSPSSDPIIATYSIYITDSQIRRFLLQYPDRQSTQPYNATNAQKPTELRLKPRTGLVEVDVPINTSVNYDERKGLRYGNALRRSRVVGEGGTMGFAGGFNAGATAGGGRKGGVGAGVGGGGEDEEIGGGSERGRGGGRAGEFFGGDEQSMMDYEDEKAGVVMTKQTLGGRIKEAVEGDPVYMLGAFRENELHLAPLSAVVQLRPQLHHLDAFDEVAVQKKALSKGKREMEEEGGAARAAPEARAIDMKVKSAETEGGTVTGNNELLKKMQDEKWEKYAWIDETDQDSWDKYEEYMFNQSPEEPLQLESAISSDDYIDGMSAPRIDPINPEMAGWAMKLRRKARRPSNVRGRAEGEQGAE